MGRSNPLTQAKRQRELAKKEKRRVKDERRAARKADRDSIATPAPLDSSVSNDEAPVENESPEPDPARGS